MPFFSKVFRAKDFGPKKGTTQNGVNEQARKKSTWEDAWTKKDVEPAEVQELLRGCVREIKARALDMPFLLLPFRPSSDPSAARTFIRNFFSPSIDRGGPFKGDRLNQELLLTEPMVLCSVMKWCWSRLPGGVITWEAYELFRIGERDSNNARDAFATFIPLSVASEAKTDIIFDFFDLMAAIAAHGKTNGMGGRKLSRLAGWWAFEHPEGNDGFEAGYKAWESAADAASHLFFAYLRSLSPETGAGAGGFSSLPLSLQTLLQATEYPPDRPILMQSTTPKVEMIVDTVSPTPFALLRRSKHFQYRDEDRGLQRFSEYDDPIDALTDECRRVLKSISSVNASSVSNVETSTSLRDASWSRFEDIGFSGFSEGLGQEEMREAPASDINKSQGLRSSPFSKTTNLGRPTTPSWADFISTGFVNETGHQAPSALLLPPDKVLPPINTRGQSSHSHRRILDNDSDLEPGELARITNLDLDDAFWWVWITSLAGEETMKRKSAFGRCALVETSVRGGKWLIMEELVKGAAPEPDPNAYIAEKKGFFSFGKRSRLGRSKSIGRKPIPTSKPEPYLPNKQASPMSKTNIPSDQHARIQAAAAALQQRQKPQGDSIASSRRARHGDAVSTKTNSVFTLQPVIMNEAAPGLQWAQSYDKGAVRAAYLGNNFAGKGSAIDLPDPSGMGPYEQIATNGTSTPDVPPKDTPKPTAKASDSPNLFVNDVKPEMPQTEDIPAPLPDVPSSERQKVDNAKADQAVEIPLPDGMTDHPKPFDKNALLGIKSNEWGPQSLSTLDRTAQAEQPDVATNGNAANSVSPKSEKTAAKKMKKKNQGGGFKGFFGRSKKQEAQSQPVPTSPAAVAAARAALQGPESPSKGKSNKRLSNAGRKGGQYAMTKPSFTSQPVTEEGPPQGEGRFIPQPDHPPRDDYDDGASLSRVGTDEQVNAEREFRTFDQGPLEDQPAFAPASSSSVSSESIEEPVKMDQEHHPLAGTNPPYEHDRDSDRSSQNSAELESDLPPVSPQERWNQIRKDAAEKLRQSEEQSRQTDRTDASETSVEETIESRVARIKARVAELTGTMEPSSANRR